MPRVLLYTDWLTADRYQQRVCVVVVALLLQVVWVTP